jgi:uncharacterized protein YbjT (DUF2867 family)
MILLTGATGVSGRPIARQLAAAGTSFRVLARNADKARAELNVPQAEVVQGDLSDAASLAKALAGVTVLLLNSSPTPDIATLQNGVIDAARKAGVKHVVKFSAAGAQAGSPVRFGNLHGQVEDHLKQSGLAWTILRPTFFHQNLLGSAGGVKADGALYLPNGDGVAPFVDVRDIAAVTVQALLHPQQHAGKSYDITGPADLSGHDLAKAIGDAIAKPVRYVPVPPEAAKQSMLAGGMDAWLVDGILELSWATREGYTKGATGAVKQVAGRDPIAFAQFARENAAAFR